MRPRLENGQWSEPFDPTEMGYSKKWRDYTESDPWETTFTVQHDPAGLIKLFGGRKAFTSKLDALFTTSSRLPPDAPPDIAGMVGQYAHGNEPCHHMAYLYCYAGAAPKTQDRVRRLLEMEYDDQPDGLAGNEDCGQMSAWYVISALGFYAVDPVSGNYVFGTPLFDRAEVEMGGSKKLVVEAKRNSPQRPIHSIRNLQRKALSKAVVPPRGHCERRNHRLYHEQFSQRGVRFLGGRGTSVVDDLRSRSQECFRERVADMRAATTMALRIGLRRSIQKPCGIEANLGRLRFLQLGSICLSTEGFNPIQVCHKCAVPFDPICANLLLFNTRPSCSRAGLIVGKSLILKSSKTWKALSGSPTLNQ